MKINFIGLAFTLVAMQAEIGTLFVTTVAKSGIENYSSIAAMAQVRGGRGKVTVAQVGADHFGSGGQGRR